MRVEDSELRDAERVGGDQHREGGADGNVGVQRGQQRPDPGGGGGDDDVESRARLLCDGAERIRAVPVAPERGGEDPHRLVA